MLMKMASHRGCFNMVYHSYSEKDTARAAAEFARTLSVGDVVCLNGDLGAGKTVFVAAAAKAIGVKEYISSPTFTIVNEYSGRIPVYHFDAYRIADADEMEEIGFDEYIYGDGVCIIEWSCNIEAALPAERYEVTIKRDYEKGEDYRLIEIKKRGR